MNRTNTLKQLTNLTFWLPSKGLETKRLQLIRQISQNLVECESVVFESVVLVSEQDMLGGERCCRRQLPSRRHGRLVSAAVGTSGKCRLVGLGTEYSVTLFPSITATATDNPTFSTSRHTLSLLLAYSSTACSLLSVFYSGSVLLVFYTIIVHTNICLALIQQQEYFIPLLEHHYKHKILVSTRLPENDTKPINDYNYP